MRESGGTHTYTHTWLSPLGQLAGFLPRLFERPSSVGHQAATPALLPAHRDIRQQLPRPCCTHAQRFSMYRSGHQAEQAGHQAEIPVLLRAHIH
eukprot:1138990-Pelagomonas_calceolata.AAC.3